jgi:NAD(P) transhydrogenase
VPLNSTPRSTRRFGRGHRRSARGTRRCDLALTARGAIAGHGGLLKLIIRADDRVLIGVHCFGDIASEVVNLGHVVVQGGGSVESFLTMALSTPTYSYAYHDAAVDGLTQLSRQMGLADGGAPGAPAP